MKNLICAAIFAGVAATASAAGAPIVLDSSDNGSTLVGYPGTLTVFKDKYQIMIGVRTPGENETRLYVAMSKKDCAAGHGTLLMRATVNDEFSDQMAVSIMTPSSLADSAATAVCAAGSSSTATKRTAM